MECARKAANPSPTLRQPFANPLPTLCQPCANPSPTLRQPFANPLPTLSACQACLWIAVGHCSGKNWGCSSDSLRYHRKHSATEVLLDLSRDKGGYFGRVTMVATVLFENVADHCLHVFKVARLQSEFCTRDSFFAYEFSYEKCSEISPNFLSFRSVGQKNPAKLPPNFPPNFPANKKNSPTSFCRSAGRTCLGRRGSRMILKKEGFTRTSPNRHGEVLPFLNKVLPFSTNSNFP